jgi:hypothetical protein
MIGWRMPDTPSVVTKMEFINGKYLHYLCLEINTELYNLIRLFLARSRGILHRHTYEWFRSEDPRSCKADPVHFRSFLIATVLLRLVGLAFSSSSSEFIASSFETSFSFLFRFDPTGTSA